LSADFTVVICTRGRPALLARTLAALEAGSFRDYPLVVVDQSDPPDPALGSRATVVHDRGRGLSRARNIGLANATTDWVVFVDDDCRPERDFAERLRTVLADHPEAALITGDVPGDHGARRDYVPASAFRVARERWLRGRFTHPGLVAFGVLFAVRREVAQRLGGFDERLGPGVPDFPAADDMDFNYRLLRAGLTAYQTPLLRARHEQWRDPAQLPQLYRGYLAAWSGFAAKHLRTGDVVGGLWLWWIGVVDVLDMAAGALVRRSPLRRRIAAAKLRGLIEGTVQGVTRDWGAGDGSYSSAAGDARSGAGQRPKST
jgi:GT2 family glycosyltransferase